MITPATPTPNTTCFGSHPFHVGYETYKEDPSLPRRGLYAFEVHSCENPSVGNDMICPAFFARTDAAVEKRVVSPAQLPVVVYLTRTPQYAPVSKGVDDLGF